MVLIVLLLSSMLFLTMKFWFMMWVMMEISLLSFTFLLLEDSKKFSSSVEISMKYFLIQIIISIFILMSLTGIIKNQLEDMNVYMNNNIIFVMSILSKMAIFPFHWWMPLVAVRMDWWKMFVMMSWLKIIPMYLLSFLSINSMMIIIMSASIMFSTMIQYFYGLTKLIITYSSIAHSSWILITILNSFLISMTFLLIYSLVLMSIVKICKQSQLASLMQKVNNSTNNKIQIMLVMLSLAGIPPLLGFFPKWVALYILYLKMNSNAIMILIFFSMTTLNFFIYSRFLFYYFFQKSFSTWMYVSFKNYSMLQWIMPMFLWFWCI